MTHEQDFDALEVLLASFISRSGADAACVMGRNGTEVPEPWAYHDTSRRNGNGFASLSAAAAAKVVRDGHTHHQAGLLATPIDLRDTTIGALCAGFAAELGGRASSVIWTARAYASAISLCLDEPIGFGSVISSVWIDHLTGARNPMALWNTLSEEINRAHRQESRLSLVFIDLDGFKAVNDRDGHLNGDAVLASVGHSLRDHLRSYDTVGRFGGDEFVVVLPGATFTDASALARRMADGVGEATAPLTEIPVTASFGVAEWMPGVTGHELLERADQRMLAAKPTGRAVSARV
jgi:diguanylate cyclase (GGDEF)-like protein